MPRVCVCVCVYIRVYIWAYTNMRTMYHSPNAILQLILNVNFFVHFSPFSRSSFTSSDTTVRNIFKFRFQHTYAHKMCCWYFHAFIVNSHRLYWMWLLELYLTSLLWSWAIVLCAIIILMIQMRSHSTNTRISIYFSFFLILFQFWRVWHSIRKHLHTYTHTHLTRDHLIQFVSTPK